MKQLKLYQEDAVEDLKDISKMYFRKDESKTIVFQAPTGSGKTFMMTSYMSDIVSETDLDICFLWVSIGSGDLQKQSKKSVEKEINPKMQCSLLEEEFFGTRERINRNEIVFLNWEKIRNKDKKTGEFTNSLMKSQDNISFIEVLDNTRSIGRKIILIIDESHSNANTERAREIRDDIIKPFLTIEMSATPVLVEDMSVKVNIDPNKVIAEQMIKKEILINYGIDKIVEDEMTSETLILESAFEKREYLQNLYLQNKSNINPLVLIQLPNSSAGEKKKETIYQFLKSKNVKDDEIAIWLSDKKINNDYDTLNNNDSKIKFLIFKQAIDTGWDCPRSQILVKFRETSSIVFEIQTVGRILRMPEAKHYNDEDLNKAYVYTNIKSIEIKKEVYNPNIIKSLYSKRKDIYEPLNLRSYYRNRVDYGDVTSSYRIFNEKEFCNYFNIERAEDKETNIEENIKKLEKENVILEPSKLDTIINNVEIESSGIDKGIKLDEADILNISLSEGDLELAFNTLIIKNLDGFAPKRSLSNVKTALIYCFRKYLGIKPANGGIVLIQNIVVGNSDIFGEIILNSIREYKDFHIEEVNKKFPGRFKNDWEIPISKNYNPETNKRIASKLSLFEPLYLPLQKDDKVDKLEADFINYLDSHEDEIEWFWKNGDEHMESNFGIQKEDGYTFQPDFIVKFKDGRIGIFDTKSSGYNESDHNMKSVALYKYLAEERYAGKNLIGGLVIYVEGRYKYYQQAIYKSYKEAKNDWKDFDTLFKR